MNKLKGQKIVSCRICKGDHWTTRCPYKDTLGPMQKELAEQLGLSTGEKEKLPGGESWEGQGQLRASVLNLLLKPHFVSRTRACSGSAEQDWEVRPTQPERWSQSQRGIHAAKSQR